MTKRLEEVYKYPILAEDTKNKIDKIRSRVTPQVAQYVTYDGSVRKILGIINESSLQVGVDLVFAHASSVLKILAIVI